MVASSTITLMTSKIQVTQKMHPSCYCYHFTSNYPRLLFSWQIIVRAPKFFPSFNGSRSGDCIQTGIKIAEVYFMVKSLVQS